jgi:hypothetical protein
MLDRFADPGDSDPKPEAKLDDLGADGGVAND